ncbi:hypothetical protein K525DRAFT_201112 [Schizophyllum commune Loenen D]|nr:hypothetical protein K525DRAFT_201112 [Schizophyllum commune Loenen D]
MQVAPSLHHVPETPGPSQTGSDASLATYFIPTITPPIPPFEGLFSTLDDSLDRDRISGTSIDVNTRGMSATSGYTQHHASVAPIATSYHQECPNPPRRPTSAHSTPSPKPSGDFTTPSPPYDAQSTWPSPGATASPLEESTLPADFSGMTANEIRCALSPLSFPANVWDDSTFALYDPFVSSRQSIELGTVIGGHLGAFPSQLARAPPDYTPASQSETIWPEVQELDELQLQSMFDSAQWTLGTQEQVPKEPALEQDQGMMEEWHGQPTSSLYQHPDATQERYAPMQQLQETLASTHISEEIHDLAARQVAHSPAWSDLFVGGRLLYQLKSGEGPPTLFYREEVPYLDASDLDEIFASNAFDPQQQDPCAMDDPFEYIVECATASDHNNITHTMI